MSIFHRERPPTTTPEREETPAQAELRRRAEDNAKGPSFTYPPSALNERVMAGGSVMGPSPAQVEADRIATAERQAREREAHEAAQRRKAEAEQAAQRAWGERLHRARDSHAQAVSAVHSARTRLANLTAAGDLAGAMQAATELEAAERVLRVAEEQLTAAKGRW